LSHFRNQASHLHNHFAFDHPLGSKNYSENIQIPKCVEVVVVAVLTVAVEDVVDVDVGKQA